MPKTYKGAIVIFKLLSNNSLLGVTLGTIFWIFMKICYLYLATKQKPIFSIFSFFKKVKNEGFHFWKAPKNPKDFYYFWLKMLSVFHFIIVYIFLYTFLGRFLFVFSWFLAVDALKTNHPIGIYFFIGSIGFIGFVCNSALSLYILVQFSDIKQFLLQILGDKVFDYYIGLNPGSANLKNLSSMAMVGLTVAGITSVSDTINTQITTNHQENLVERYLKTCNEHGADSPQALTMKNVVDANVKKLGESNSFLGRFFGSFSGSYQGGSVSFDKR